MSNSRALTGALLAVPSTAIPLSLYYAMGRFTQRLRTVAGWWFASLPVLFSYSLYVALFVAAAADCPPGCMG